MKLSKEHGPLIHFDDLLIIKLSQNFITYSKNVSLPKKEKEMRG